MVMVMVMVPVMVMVMVMVMVIVIVMVMVMVTNQNDNSKAAIERNKKWHDDSLPRAGSLCNSVPLDSAGWQGDSPPEAGFSQSRRASLLNIAHSTPHSLAKAPN